MRRFFGKDHIYTFQLICDMWKRSLPLSLTMCFIHSKPTKIIACSVSLVCFAFPQYGKTGWFQYPAWVGVAVTPWCKEGFCLAHLERVACMPYDGRILLEAPGWLCFCLFLEHRSLFWRRGEWQDSGPRPGQGWSLGYVSWVCAEFYCHMS